MKSHLAALFVGTMLSPAKYFFKARGLLKRDDFAIKEVFSFDDNYQEFWKRCRKYEKIMVERTAERMNWRFTRVPRRDYKILFAVQNEEVRAYLVYREIEFRGVKIGLLVDLLTEPSVAGNTAGKLLIDQTVRNLTEKNVGIIGCVISEQSSEASLLKESGFMKCPRFILPQPVAFTMIIHSQDMGIRDQELEDINNWFLTLGDYDVG